MSNKNLKEFRKERAAVLRSLDPKKVVEFHKKWNNSVVLPTWEVVEIAMHKARTACRDLNRDERLYSKQWLTERGYRSMDEGELNERVGRTH